MTAPLFLSDPHLVAGLTAGDTLLLDGAEGRHAAKAKRLAPGEAATISDGAGLRLAATVTESGPSGVRLRIENVSRDGSPAVTITLVQALAKGDRDELAVQAATELGADEIIPWQAERSVVVWRGDRAAKGWHRWAAIVREATKQSRRTFLPPVAQPVDTPQLAAQIAARVAAGATAWVLDAAGAQPISLAPLPAPSPGAQVMVIVGPEGGIGETELHTLTAAGATPIKLGTEILRTSTAGPAAIAALELRLGRW